MQDSTNEEVTKPQETTKTTKAKSKEKPIILKNIFGKDMKEADYFYSEDGESGKAPSYFNKTCGLPVDREDLVEVFNEVFDPEHNVLFYKTPDKELYIIIIPLKYATTVSRYNESVDGDFQKHAISFINEGSVNIDTLRSKLSRIIPFCDFNAK